MRRLLLLLPLCLILAPEARRPRPVEPAAPPVKATPEATSARMESLAKSDPVAFLEACIARYDREVSSYRVLLVKQERIAGTLHPPEHMLCRFREKPFSVLMEWQQGARLAFRTLYVEGENDGQLLVRPAGLLSLAGVVTRDPEGTDAKASARYTAPQFGIQKGTQRTLYHWMKARDRGELRVVFNGLKPVPELGGLKCWELVRPDFGQPEDGGVMSATFYFDPANWMQVGSVLRGKDGEVIGTYFWRDLELNAEHAKDTFTREALSK